MDDNYKANGEYDRGAITLGVIALLIVLLGFGGLWLWDEWNKQPAPVQHERR